MLQMETYVLFRCLKQPNALSCESALNSGVPVFGLIKQESALRRFFRGKIDIAHALAFIVGVLEITAVVILLNPFFHDVGS